MKIQSPIKHILTIVLAILTTNCIGAQPALSIPDNIEIVFNDKTVIVKQGTVTPLELQKSLQTGKHNINGIAVQIRNKAETPLRVSLCASKAHIYTKKEFVDLLGVIPNSDLMNVIHYMLLAGTVLTVGATITAIPIILVFSMLGENNRQGFDLLFYYGSIGAITILPTALMALATYLTGQSSGTTKEVLEKVLRSVVFDPQSSKTLDEGEAIEQFIFFDNLKSSDPIELCLSKDDKETIVPLTL